jgi:hypothetical protein
MLLDCLSKVFVVTFRTLSVEGGALPAVARAVKLFAITQVYTD